MCHRIVAQTTCRCGHTPLAIQMGYAKQTLLENGWRTHWRHREAQDIVYEMSKREAT
jgi:hypothetical protein